VQIPDYKVGVLLAHNCVEVPYRYMRQDYITDMFIALHNKIIII